MHQFEKSSSDYFVLGLQYEPELFPGLIYRMKQPKIVLLIFVSGKVVLTGESHDRSAHLSAICARNRSYVQMSKCIWNGDASSHSMATQPHATGGAIHSAVGYRRYFSPGMIFFA